MQIDITDISLFPSLSGGPKGRLDRSASDGGINRVDGFDISNFGFHLLQRYVKELLRGARPCKCLR